MLQIIAQIGMPVDQFHSIQSKVEQHLFAPFGPRQPPRMTERGLRTLEVRPMTSLTKSPILIVLLRTAESLSILS